MFEHRPMIQRLLIRQIRAFPERIIETAQRSFRFAVGAHNMPYTDDCLLYLLEGCKKLDAAAKAGKLSFDDEKFKLKVKRILEG